MSGNACEDLHLQRMLGAWALHACSAEETERIEEHLSACASCAAEAQRLRSASEFLHPHMDLDLPPTLRAEVLGACLGARPPQVAVPDYAKPYDAETARLDGLLADLAEDEWAKPVQLQWFEGDDSASHSTSVGGVLGHLVAVDGMVSASLGLPDPVTPDGKGSTDPQQRTEALWKQMESPEEGSDASGRADGSSVRSTWRDQAYELIRTCAYGGGGVADIAVPYGEDVVLPLRLALLDRAFETWIHATDIADAVDYPYPPPVPEHLQTLIGVAVQMLPSILAARRQAGLASPPLPVVEPGASERSVRLEIEGESGGEWYLPLDRPDGPAGPDNCVSHIVLPEVEFCRLAAGHLAPRQAATGQQGDQTAIVELLYAMASMSRL
ncbi:maleylpyruvate isomerase N-terminal domain-containing protein [Streptomyces sp. cg35]|uniref:maleylpyruvate isomerase N-terminal domain-containing protein n=1 Tax=Streptomyces sp. cg35 TaxID=3421650 RepID=UPI003D165BEA